MKVLIACEFSGVVRDEFLKLGHDAVSCDLLPSESDRGRHILGDVRDVIKSERWHLMIAHPPCTFLSNAGNRHFKNNPERCKKREEALSFAMSLYNADIPRVCIENPQGYLNSHFRRPDQIIHPWMFGDHEMKRTCLWLRGLPKLYYSVQFPQKPEPYYIRTTDGHRMHFTDASHCSQGLTRWQTRARTFHGIAEAMAVQWGSAGSQYFYEKYAGVV